jgi:alkylation response protein AidB-like acyl-CoA dehydrogenase
MTFAEFVRTEVAPHAHAWDRDQALPVSIVRALGTRGWLGGMVDKAHGGDPIDGQTFVGLNEALGAGCSSLRSVLTVHSMVTYAINRWGTPPQKERWLPRLASGELVGAFALTEPEAGSDIGANSTTAVSVDGGFVLNGTKRWITYGQRADVFLVLAGTSAFLVPRDASGLEIEPQRGVLGTRASMLAEIRLRDCVVDSGALVGRQGFGLAAVAATALEVGRLSVAAGCVGIVQACLDLSVEHAGNRRQFGARIGDHQLVRQMITDMATGAAAARALCHEAAALRDARDRTAVRATWMAKYFASTQAFRAAADAVQIHGASGCAEDHPAQRMLRDAKVMEIIEGTTQLQQNVIAESYLSGGGQ